MPPAPEESRRMPSWLLYSLAGALGLVAIAGIAVFTYTALTDDSDVLPYRWRAWIENLTGDGKVVKPQADSEPAPWGGAKHEAAADAPPADGAEAAAALAPIETAAVSADAAIAAYRDSRDDQKLAIVAQQAIDAIRRIPVNVKDDAATQTAVLELRDEKAAARQHALEDARRVSRATHEVTATHTRGPSRDSPLYLPIYAAANEAARKLGQLQDGDRVHTYLTTGSGWSRIEVLTGAATGQNGYVLAKFLRPIPAADGTK